MEVEIEAMIEDTEILRYVSESKQSTVIKNNALKIHNRDLSANLMILTLLKN